MNLKNKMKLISYKKLIKYELYRNLGKKKCCFFFLPPQIKFLVMFRHCQYAKKLVSKSFYRIVLNYYRNKTGNEISSKTNIGPGLFLGHAGPRYINVKSNIGSNCNINQGVTIGQENRGKREGCPTIGNNVWIGAYAVVVGKITIEDDVLIAPLSFVNFDVPQHSVVVGNPGVIHHKENATFGYINETIDDYDILS